MEEVLVPRAYTHLALAVAAATSYSACGSATEQLMPITPGAVPTLSVVTHLPDSTLLRLDNPGDITWGYNPCPVAAQEQTDSGWTHAGYLVRPGSSVCELSLTILVPGQTQQFWLPAPVPTSDYPLRLSIVVTDQAENFDLTVATLPLALP
jgi:hypothetical protein